MYYILFGEFLFIWLLTTSSIYKLSKSVLGKQIGMMRVFIEVPYGLALSVISSAHKIIMVWKMDLPKEIKVGTVVVFIVGLVHFLAFYGPILLIILFQVLK